MGNCIWPIRLHCNLRSHFGTCKALRSRASACGLSILTAAHACNRHLDVCLNAHALHVGWLHMEAYAHALMLHEEMLTRKRKKCVLSDAHKVAQQVQGVRTLHVMTRCPTRQEPERSYHCLNM